MPGTNTTTRRPSTAARTSVNAPRETALVIWPVGANVAHAEAPPSPRRMNKVSATHFDPQIAKQRSREAAAVTLQHGAQSHLICTERHRGGQQEVLTDAIDPLQHVALDEALERPLDVDELFVAALVDERFRRRQ